MQAASVITTVLNEREDVASLVESLENQSFTPAEVIVVDGGSSDGTWEWLQDAARRYPNLRPIRDESCSLKYCAGPISRGRNVGISAATSDVVACTDAGCVHQREWLENLTRPILEGQAEYAQGGECLDMSTATSWDIASAPFLGVKLSIDAPIRSGTARSMAFRKDLWRRIGGFPETVFMGEDTLFDQNARAVTTPAFVNDAKALYRPRHTFRSAMRQMASYAVTDGVTGVRPARLVRNVARCVAEVISLAVLPWTFLPLVCVAALEIFWAFRLDWRSVRGMGLRVLMQRLFFSLLVPWVVAWNQIAGALTKAYRPNRQNAVSEIHDLR